MKAQMIKAFDAVRSGEKRRNTSTSNDPQGARIPCPPADPDRERHAGLRRAYAAPPGATVPAQPGEFGPSGPWLGRNAPLERFVRASPHPSSSVVAKGIHNVGRLIAACDKAGLPAPARKALNMLADQLIDSQKKIGALTADIRADAQANDAAQRLQK